MEALQSLGDIARTAVVLTLILTALVAVHELGHYWFAKLCGMQVDSFAVMMGGVRKTDLSRFLPKPLAPGKFVWLAVAWCLLAMFLGITFEIGVLFLAGLAALAIAVPTWVALRLQALYHMKRSQALITMAKVWGVTLIALGLATRFQGVAATELLGILLIGSSIGLLFIYYHPLSRRPEDAPMGHGVLEIDGAEPEEPEGERGWVPVRFRPLWYRTDKHGTEFSLLVLPLGGFCAIKGMHPKEDGSEVHIPGGFYNHPPWQRLIVLAAGPIFSVAFGVILLTGVFSLKGIPAALDVPVVGVVGEDGPAAAAGIKAGDRILRVDGQPVSTFFDVVSRVRGKIEGEEGARKAVPVEITYLSEGVERTATITPMVDDKPSSVLGSDLESTEEKRIQAKLGIGPSLGHKPMTFAAATREALMKPVELVQGLAGMITKISTAKDAVGGPGTIATATASASESGIWSVLTLAGLLSISLGVLNLLPIPLLDGGQIVVAIVEMLRGGKRLSLQVQQAMTTVGIALIFLIMLGAATVDIGRFVGKDDAPKAAAPAK